MKGYISIQIKVDLKANLYRSFVVFYIYCHWRSKGGGGCDSINRFNPATFLYLSQALTSISNGILHGIFSNGILHGLFLCSMIEMRGVCFVILVELWTVIA